MFVLESADKPGYYVTGTIEQALDEHKRHSKGEIFCQFVWTTNIDSANVYSNSEKAIERIITYVQKAMEKKLPTYDGRICARVRLAEVRYNGRSVVRVL